MFVAVVCLLAWAGQAVAQAAVLRRPALHWVREDEALHCVDPRTLAERVEELVGPVLVRAPEAEHSVEAQVRHGKQGTLRVEVRVLNVWGAKVGERMFEQRVGDCTELTPAISFVIAMMIDPDVAAHGLPPALVALLGEEPAEEKLMHEIDGAPPQPPLPPPPPPTSPPVVRRARPRLDHESPIAEPPTTAHQLAALVRGAWGESARGTVGLELRYVRRAGSPRSGVGGYTRFGQEVGRTMLGSGRALQISTLDFGIQACGGQLSTAWLRTIGCLGVEVTTAFGRGEGFTPNRLQVMTTGAAVAQLTARVRITAALGVMLSIGVRAALERREFSYRSVDGTKVRAVRTDIVGWAIALGPSWEL